AHGTCGSGQWNRNGTRGSTGKSPDAWTAIGYHSCTAVARHRHAQFRRIGYDRPREIPIATQIFLLIRCSVISRNARADTTNVLVKFAVSLFRDSAFSRL